ncbi:MAG TPA: hypothetical protein QF564_26345 [Pirellulaceae bacterium]|jgi:hypothetical protein|nr:hypothetical protein [Pirellulaceae bacterium]
MSSLNRSSRRRFLTDSAQGACSLGIVGAVGSLTTQNVRGEETVKPKYKIPKYKITAQFETRAVRPRGIAVGSNGRVYIASDRQVLAFNAAGEPEGAMKFDRPVRCIATRSTGDVLVGLAHHVDVLDANLHRKQQWASLGNESLITGLATAGEATFIADSTGRLVWHRGTDGTVMARIRRTAAGFSSPLEYFTLAAGGEGKLHVANPLRHRVETYTIDGEFVSSWGQRSRDLAGFSGCCNPVSLAVLSKGQFVTAERGQPRVKVYDSAGRFESLVAGPDDFESNAIASLDDDTCSLGGIDLTVDSRDRIYVLDRVTGVVRIIV